MTTSRTSAFYPSNLRPPSRRRSGGPPRPRPTQNEKAEVSSILHTHLNFRVGEHERSFCCTVPCVYSACSHFELRNIRGRFVVPRSFTHISNFELRNIRGGVVVPCPCDYGACLHFELRNIRDRFVVPCPCVYGTCSKFEAHPTNNDCWKALPTFLKKQLTNNHCWGTIRSPPN